MVWSTRQDGSEGLYNHWGSSRREAFVHARSQVVFRVLFWICIYNGPNEARVYEEYDRLNYMDTRALVKMKAGIISEMFFMETVSTDFLDHYKPLIPCVNRLL
jgi:hypothetical protein